MSPSLKRFRTLFWFLRIIFRIPDLFTGIFRVKLRLHESYIESWLVPMYFKLKYVPLAKHVPVREVQKERPETIWQYWTTPTDGITPPVIDACFDTVDRYKGDKKHIIVTDKTISDYVDLPGHIYDVQKNPKVLKAHFADILRLALLHEHGGVWMDATDYMTAPIPKFIDDAEFFVMHTKGSLKGCGSEYSFMQNCFIRSQKGSYLLDAWYKLLLEYWKNEDKTISYFQHQLMFKSLVAKDPRAKEFYKKMPYMEQAPTHLLSQERMLEPFDAARWEEIKKSSFFQKLKSQYRDYPPGSFVDVLSREKL